MPDKITLSYVNKQIKQGYSYLVVRERKTKADSIAVSAHRNYEAARKARSATDAIWLLEDVRKELQK